MTVAIPSWRDRRALVVSVIKGHPTSVYAPDTLPKRAVIPRAVSRFLSRRGRRRRDTRRGHRQRCRPARSIGQPVASRGDGRAVAQYPPRRPLPSRECWHGPKNSSSARSFEAAQHPTSIDGRRLPGAHSVPVG
jgi:hypothetical protein